MPESATRLHALTEALQAEAWEPAFSLFRRLLRAPDRSDFRAWVEQAWTSFAGREDRAELHRSLRSAQSEQIAALLVFVRAAFGSGHIACALAASRAARARAPQQPAPVFLLCLLLLKRGDREAQETLQHCLTHFPQPSAGWAEIGHELLRSGKKDAALICFARAGPDATAAMTRGLLARELGRRDQARAAFEEVVKLNPHSARGWFLLGTCAQDAGDFAIAMASYRAALVAEPSLAEAAVNLGTVLQETGDLEGARAAYRRAVGQRPDTFGRVAQALTTSPKGELWLDLAALRRDLAGSAMPTPVPARPSRAG